MTSPDGSHVPPPQYTVEGEIYMAGEFAAGAARATGWRRTLARVLISLVLLSIVGTTVVYLVTQLR